MAHVYLDTYIEEWNETSVYIKLLSICEVGYFGKYVCLFVCICVGTCVSFRILKFST